MKICISVFCIGLLIAGCTSSQKNYVRNYGYPAPYKFTDARILKHNYKDSSFRTNYDTFVENKDWDSAKLERNAILNELMYAIEAGHGDFERNTRAWKSAADFFTDIAILGVNGAGTVVGGETVKSILHVVSGGLAGSQLALNKRILADQGIEAIQAQMRAAMEQQKARIISKMTNSVTAYPLEMGLSDIVDYYYDGTFTRALQNILHDAEDQQRRGQLSVSNALVKAAPLLAPESR